MKELMDSEYRRGLLIALKVYLFLVFFVLDQ